MPLRPGRSLVIAGALAACGPRARPTRPTPTPAPTPEPAAPTPTAAPAATRFAYLGGSASYDVRSESSVEMTAGPDAERGRERATVTAQVTYELTPSARGPVAVRGQVDALSMDASSRIGGATPPPAEPVRFQGWIDGRGPRLDAQGAVFGCVGPAGTAQAAGIAAAREAALYVPAIVAVSAKWRDSATVVTCRGPVPTTVTTVARYEITAIDGARVQVRRETTLRMRGQAIAGGRSVSVTGTGEGTAAIELDATLGRLTRIDGDMRATVTVTLPDGARAFAQQIHTEVRRRP
ncbi:hypothetical protein J421_1141 [Gemmatirosa kalamazoonensis]|uniref:Lipoprotein n=1 Tax=Gemmatirosa kalamazoonensis TaxID=861299 RepID=W0RH09_9BACT|nr:hypothetical protein [Gemmatirosa kalamazoonensis]AHG88678.1 hypothetical protein J421_1141 [Gemmatirosa kalamazoonensis]